MTTPARPGTAAGRIPAQRPPPSDPWIEATAAGARAFRTAAGEPDERAAGAVAAALFVYSERVAQQYAHRMFVTVGKSGKLWAAARCTCGGLDGPRRRGMYLDEHVQADYDRHVDEVNERKGSP